MGLLHMPETTALEPLIQIRATREQGLKPVVTAAGADLHAAIATLKNPTEVHVAAHLALVARGSLQPIEPPVVAWSLLDVGRDGLPGLKEAILVPDWAFAGLPDFTAAVAELVLAQTAKG